MCAPFPGSTANIRANLRTPLPQGRSSSAARRASAATRHSSATRCRRFSRSSRTRNCKANSTEATAAAARAMDELTAWLESQRATATDEFALGAPKFREMLRETERVDLPLEELELVGRKDLERNLAALSEACAAYAPKASLAACVEKMRANKPAGGTRRRRTRAARRTAPVRHRQEDRHASRARSRRWSRSRRRTTAAISRTSASRARMKTRPSR